MQSLHRKHGRFPAGQEIDLAILLAYKPYPVFLSLRVLSCSNSGLQGTPTDPSLYLRWQSASNMSSTSA